MLVEIKNLDQPGAEPIRVALNNADVTSTVTGESETFAGGIFSIELPGEEGDTVSNVSITVDNVDQRIMLAARASNQPPMVRLWIVLASSDKTPDDVEAGPFKFRLDNVSYDKFQVRGDLVFEDLVNRRWPQHDFTPFTTPGVF
jgi:hypothetical protein